MYLYPGFHKLEFVPWNRSFGKTQYHLTLLLFHVDMWLVVSSVIDVVQRDDYSIEHRDYWHACPFFNVSLLRPSGTADQPHGTAKAPLATGQAMHLAGSDARDERRGQSLGTGTSLHQATWRFLHSYATQTEGHDRSIP